ncbi:hypothetical protein A4D02_17730 [Niastella koreensis]|uniref:Uncharacterized protein n=1 Tax=Niastella koreensis TaxID=354356 RepID=A0ABX3NLV2_9BACT|nr:hypothetical protein A4D02_17730 [Niastella koreensis]
MRRDFIKLPVPDYFTTNRVLTGESDCTCIVYIPDRNPLNRMRPLVSLLYCTTLPRISVSCQASLFPFFNIAALFSSCAVCHCNVDQD